MIVLYMLYIVVMYFNPRLGNYFIGKYDAWKNKSSKSEPADYEQTERDPLLKSAEKSGNSLVKSGNSFTHNSQKYDGQSNDNISGRHLNKQFDSKLYVVYYSIKTNY